MVMFGYDCVPEEYFSAGRRILPGSTLGVKPESQCEPGCGADCGDQGSENLMLTHRLRSGQSATSG